ncbi:MAG: fibronectin type III domain-containing protein [Chlamydiales bacterium]|nr:fibronectin type III domain-containing protein [Chlamydiales bacterium]
MKKLLAATFVILGVAIFSLWQKGEGSPSALYLTWLHDPATTMTVQWHSEKEEQPRVYYKSESEGSWHEACGAAHVVGQATLIWGDLRVNTVELTQLNPDTVYAFRLGESEEIYRFRTMPQNPTRPIHFVVGGDVYQDEILLLKKMNSQVAKMDPDFIVIGGDIAYARGRNYLFKGRYFEIKRWKTFFTAWKEQMATSDGRLIPLVVAIGNHDLESTHPNPRVKPVLFYEFFAMSEPYTSYRTLNYGSYLSLTLLDTGHTYPIRGEQTSWLENTLKANEKMQHKMAVYHVSAYPSVYNYDKGNRKQIRRYWTPLFDQYGVKTVFEHHDHAFKRTHRLKQGKIDPDGTLYFGDGAWAVNLRTPNPADKLWYLAKTDSRNFVYLVSLDGPVGVVQAIDNEGTIFDETHLTSQ